VEVISSVDAQRSACLLANAFGVRSIERCGILLQTSKLRLAALKLRRDAADVMAFSVGST
jgi:hypothetical protein